MQAENTNTSWMEQLQETIITFRTGNKVLKKFLEAYWGPEELR